MALTVLVEVRVEVLLAPELSLEFGGVQFLDVAFLWKLRSVL